MIPYEIDSPFELVCKRLFVQEHVGIMIVAVEAILHLPHAADDVAHVAIPAEDHERSIRSLSSLYHAVEGLRSIRLGLWKVLRDLVLDIGERCRLSVGFMGK